MMITDQAEALRALRRGDAPAAASGVRTIAVSSGKGGVGKSNIVVNTAIRLSRLGHRVAVLDADLGAANLDVLCNVQPLTNLAHVVAGRRRLADTIVSVPGGFDLIPGASGLGQIAGLAGYERDRLIEQFQELAGGYDLLIVDTAAGISPNVLSFACCADEVLVVTTPEPTAMTDAYALIKVMHRRGADAGVHLVVNMVQNDRQARAVYQRISQVCGRFLQTEVHDGGFVLSDPSIRRCVLKRTPAMLADPESDACRCISRVAKQIANRNIADGSRNLFERMSLWLTR